MRRIGSPAFGALLVIASLVMGGCTPEGEPDEGGPDAAAGSDADAGTGDAGTGDSDAGTGDAGTDDADAGTDDAGTDDAGTDDAGTDDGGTPAPSEPPELAGTLKAHNDAREAEGAGLPPLTWDPALEAVAKGWADGCRDSDGNGMLDHNPNRSASLPYYVGENLAGSNAAMTGPQAVRLWIGEKASYDHGSNLCTGVCGHYTQVIWKTTLRLGCARSNCPSLTYGNAIVCNYGPGGNVNGQRPY